MSECNRHIDETSTDSQLKCNKEHQWVSVKKLEPQEALPSGNPVPCKAEDPLIWRAVLECAAHLLTLKENLSGKCWNDGHLKSH